MRIEIVPTIGNAKIASFVAALDIRKRLMDRMIRENVEWSLAEALKRAHAVAAERVTALQVTTVEARIPARGARKEQRS